MPYTKPTPADLRLRYPSFAAADDATIQYWLTDADRGVDESWAEADYAPGLMALAAHNMSVNGIGSGGSSASIPAGVTSFKSANFSVSFSDAAAAQSAEGGFSSSRYGKEYAEMARKRSAGGFTTAGGYLPCATSYGWSRWT